MQRKVFNFLVLAFVLCHLQMSSATIQSDLCDAWVGVSNNLLANPQKAYTFSSEIHILCKHLDNWYRNSIIRVAENNKLTNIYVNPIADNIKYEIREFIRQAENSLSNHGDKFVFYQFMTNYYHKYLHCQTLANSNEFVDCLKTGIEVMNYRALIQMTRPDNNYGTLYRDFVWLYKHSPNKKCDKMP